MGALTVVRLGFWMARCTTDLSSGIYAPTRPKLPPAVDEAQTLMIVLLD